MRSAFRTPPMVMPMVPYPYVAGSLKGSAWGDQDPSYLFAELSDCNVARILVEPNGYSRWNSITQTRVPMPSGDNTVISGKVLLTR